jgi:hypothetical protein
LFKKLAQLHRDDSAYYLLSLLQEKKSGRLSENREGGEIVVQRQTFFHLLYTLNALCYILSAIGAPLSGIASDGGCHHRFSHKNDWHAMIVIFFNK